VSDFRQPLFRNLPRRAYLTVREHGWRELFSRLLAAPLRILRLEDRARQGIAARRARRWYRKHGRPVTVIVPTYGDPSTTIETVERLRRTLPGDGSRAVVVDDGSEPRHRERLRGLDGVELELAEENAGYAASVNRGLERAGGDHDVVVINNDVLAFGGWLEILQQAAYVRPDLAIDVPEMGIVGPKLLYPDRRIQSAGSYRNPTEPEWFDHRHRFKPARHGPAEVPSPALAMTGACLYVRRDLLDEIGPMDPELPMGYEDVDWCLRAWDAGRSVLYTPSPELIHLESVTRGPGRSERELSSQRHFWDKWGARFDERDVTTGDGHLRVVYVTEGTEVGGGHRDIFEHLNRLRARGHEVALYTLDPPPDWFPLEAPVRSFDSYEALSAALGELDAIKIASWWATAWPVWLGSVRRGIPAYFVQDIETSYYPNPGPRDELFRRRVLATYREEFSFVTISDWNRERLAEMGIEAELVPPGIDLDNFRPLEDVRRRDDMLLAVGRAIPIKNLPLTVEGWKRLDPRPELCMFGTEPFLGPKYGARYVEAPSDEEVNRLFNQATVFIQTSRHEGFCLPLLEAMATGCAVVSTDAHGNRDFCRDGENCLIVDDDPESVRAALARLWADPALRARLGEAGRRTAAGYAWERRIDQLEDVLGRIAARAPRRSSAPRG
jgi:glycosyltransferase involved in cell wall biosynthesis